MASLFYRSSCYSKMDTFLTLCIFFLLCLPASPSLADDSTEAPKQPTFPNLLDSNLRKIRLQYELTGYYTEDFNVSHHKIEHRSNLLEEVYSLDRNIARVVTYTNGKSKSNYDFFYWMRQNDTQTSFWLKPFTCTSSTISIQDNPILCSSIKDSFPEPLLPLLTYTDVDTDTRLFGLSSILAHTVMDPKLRKVPTRNIWQLKLQDSIIMNFNMMNVEEEKVMSPLSRLIGFQVNIESRNKFKLQVSVLQADNDFPDSLLELPVEYGCKVSSDLPKDFDPQDFKPSPRIEYKLEASIMIDNPRSGTIQSPIVTGPIPIKPIHTMDNPKVQLVSVSWVNDFLDNLIAIDREDLFNVWKLDEKQMFEIDKNRNTCNGPQFFEITEHNQNEDTTNLTKYCSSESVEFKLSSDLTIKLNSEAKRLIRFAVPDKKKLIRVRLTQIEQYDLTYLDNPDELCIFHRGKLITESIDTVRVIKKFTYNGITKEVSHETTSIFIFTDSQYAKLLMQVDLKSISSQHYQPWSKAKHLIDLSSCNTGPRETALLTIEYPLMYNWSGLEQVEKPHDLIRQAIASYLTGTYHLTLMRIPQIDVHMEPGLLKVQVKLLERLHLYLDSTYLPKLNVELSSYQNFLRRATKSVISSDIKSCADYCEQYSCLVFVYCKTMQSCFIFNTYSNFASTPGGSYEDSIMTCEARMVHEKRISTDKTSWLPKKSWSLEEIIENIEESLETPELSDELSSGRKSHKLALFLAARWRSTPTLSRLIRLKPQYVYHQYEHETDGYRLEEFATHGTKMDRVIRSNFALLLSGWTFATKLQSQTTNLHHLDLQDTGGYWSDAGYTLHECIQLCLQDPKCLTLSYCTTKVPYCFLTKFNPTELVSLLNEKKVSDDVRLNQVSLRQDDSCSVMKRTFFDQFEYFEDQSRTDLPDIIDTLEVESAEDCAASCIANRIETVTSVARSSCLSFSYCKSDKDNQKSHCLLHERHLISQAGRLIDDELPSKLRLNSLNFQKNMKTEMCQHYVRKFMADFTRLNKRKLPEKFVSLKLSNYEEDESKRAELGAVESGSISLNHCAKLCEEDENCGAFDYCNSNNPNAPDRLKLSCSIGSRETLELLPEVVSNRSVGSSPEVYLESNTLCVVYIYRSKSVVFGHKRRYSGSRVIIAEVSEEKSPIFMLIYADMMIFGLFFFFAAMWTEQHPTSTSRSRFKFRRFVNMEQATQDPEIELTQHRLDGSVPQNPPGT